MKCTIPPSADGEWKCDGEATQTDGMCDSCRAFGWITDPTIIAQEIAKDPVLKDKVDIVSPIQIYGKECKLCHHESCPACLGCHNNNCTRFVYPVKMCFDRLLPTPPTEETR